MIAHDRLVAPLLAALALFAFGCSTHPPARAPIEMVKIETSPASASGQTPPLTYRTDIPATSSANDLDNSGPKVAEPPKAKTTDKPVFASPDNYVELKKHSDVPVGGNLQGYSR